MIENDQQYKVTKEQLQQFRDALETMKGDKLAVHPILRAAHIAALTSQIQELEIQIKEYEAKRN